MRNVSHILNSQSLRNTKQATPNIPARDAKINNSKKFIFKAANAAGTPTTNFTEVSRKSDIILIKESMITINEIRRKEMFY